MCFVAFQELFDLCKKYLRLSKICITKILHGIFEMEELTFLLCELRFNCLITNSFIYERKDILNLVKNANTATVMGVVNIYSTKLWQFNLFRLGTLHICLSNYKFIWETSVRFLMYLNCLKIILCVSVLIVALLKPN